jgi:hypothetical protein
MSTFVMACCQIYLLKLEDSDIKNKKVSMLSFHVITSLQHCGTVRKPQSNFMRRITSINVLLLGNLKHEPSSQLYCFRRLFIPLNCSRQKAVF